MLPQVYPRSGTSTDSSTSSPAFVTGSSSSTSSASPSSQSPSPFSKGSSSSFFTFLVALLILVLASGALVVRAVYLRRRFRNRVQAAIEAGLLNLDRPFTQQTKPELYEIHVRSLPNNNDTPLEWSKLLPISAINLDESTPSGKELNAPIPSLPPPRLRVQQRINHALRRLPISNDISKEYSEKQQPNDEPTIIPSRLQVAVLIAMPSEYPSIHPLDQESSEGDLKGKRRDSSFHDDSIPDVIFGVSSLPLQSSQSNTL